MKKTMILSAAALLLAACCNQPKFDGPTYLNPNAPVEERVEDALARITLEEKVGMTTAQSKFSSRGVPRLGIPEVWHTDGPHGIRPEGHGYSQPVRHLLLGDLAGFAEISDVVLYGSVVHLPVVKDRQRQK